MYHVGDKVQSPTTGEYGVVEVIHADTASIRWSDGVFEAVPNMGTALVWVEDAPGPSAGDDPVHTAMLRHARNAGAAVTALEIIRREAKRALDTNADFGQAPYGDACMFIQKFADDVLSHVLPA